VTISGLTPDELAVWIVVNRHRGRRQAIGLDAVAATAGLTERVVQIAVAHLIEEYGMPIGSAVKKPMGYFLIETEEELAEAVTQLVHRVRALVRRIAALKKSTGPLVLQQLEIEWEQGAA